MSERRFRRSPGGVCWLGPHLVWGPKYRRQLLGGRVARRLDGLRDQIAAEYGWPSVAREVMGRSCTPGGARLADRAPAKVLWSPSYFVVSVGDRWESPVRRDIEHRWEAVRAS